jgi:hypothetical protein
MRLCFIVHYADGTVFRGTSLAEWEALPEEGILVVTEFYDRSYGHPPKHAGQRHAGLDYYWMDENGEIGAGPAKYIPEGVNIKRGQLVDDETWDRIYNAACVDPNYGTLS